MTVTVDFVEHADGTEVRLVHEGLPSEVVQYVKPGWTAAFVTGSVSGRHAAKIRWGVSKWGPC